jgi:hypothetical protein
MFKEGDRVTVRYYWGGERTITGTVMRKTPKGHWSGSPSGNYWTISRDDHVSGGDPIDHNWICIQEDMELLGPTTGGFFD